MAQIRKALICLYLANWTAHRHNRLFLFRIACDGAVRSRNGEALNRDAPSARGNRRPTREMYWDSYDSLFPEFALRRRYLKGVIMQVTA